MHLHLPAQPYVVLKLLLLRPGEIVTREELHQALWPDQPFTGLDRGLNTAIAKLREFLNDSPIEPRYIETLPKRGYRLIMPVRLPEGYLPPAASPPPAAENIVALPAAVPARIVPSSSAPAIWGKIFFAAAMLAAAGLFAGVLWRLRSPLGPPVLSHPRRLTSDGAPKWRIATDGRRLYFPSRNSAGGVSIALDGGAASRYLLPVNFVFAPLDLLASRDWYLGQQLAAPYGPRRPAQLWVIALQRHAAWRVGRIRAEYAVWGPSGRHIFYSRGKQLYRVRSDGSHHRRLLRATARPFNLAVSPHGRRLRFWTIQHDRTWLWQVLRNGRRLRPILAGWGHPAGECCGHWTADGHYYLFQSSRSGVANIWALAARDGWLHPAARRPVKITNSAVAITQPLPGAGGHRLFVEVEQPQEHLLRYDSAVHAWLPYHGGQPMRYVSFSRDGHWMAYVDYVNHALYRQRAGGADRLELTFPPSRVALPRWSPGGHRLAFMARQPGENWKIYLLAASGGTPRRLAWTPGPQADPNWSPHGRRIVFSGAVWSPGIHLLNLASGKITAFPGSRRLFSPRWSPDGRYLAALGAQRYHLWLYSFAARRWRVLLRGDIGYPTWSHQGHWIYFRDGELSERVRIPSGRIERLGRINVPEIGGGLGDWLGLDRRQQPLLLQQAGDYDIYSFRLFEPPY